ncbi:MAG: TRAP transporter TatT component family protein [Candidatus Bipolaricaulota bacterium]
MKQALAVLLCAIGITALGGVEMELDEALALIPEHHVMISYDDEGREQLEAAIEAFRSALEVPPELDELDEQEVNRFPVDRELRHVVNKLSQSYYTLADAFLEDESGEAEETYLKGKHWGLRSLRLNPDFATLEPDYPEAVQSETDVPALYWAMANWLRAAEFDVMGAVTGRVPPKAEALALRILELDPTYVNYGVYRTLGAFWSGLPSSRFERAAVIAMGLGRYVQDLSRALEYLCHVVDEPELCPHGPVDPQVDEYFENRVFFAEFYLMEEEKWDEAERILQSVLDEPIGDKYPLYNALSQERAAELLETIEGR